MPRDDDNQQETYQITHIIKIIINSLAQIYQDKQIQPFLNKLISRENLRKIMMHFKPFFRLINYNISNETSKILNLLNESSDSKLITRKCYILKDRSNTNYSVGNEIIYSTEVLKSNLRVTMMLTFQ